MARAEHDVDRRGERRIEQRVLDVDRAVAEHARVVRQRVAVGQRAERPDRGERQQQQAEMRRQHERQDQQHDAHRPATLSPARQLAPRQPAAAALHGGVVLALQRPRRGPHGDDRDDDQHDRDHVAHRIGDADRGDAQIGLRRQHVLDVEQQRRGEVVEHLDEHQRRAGDVARQREREDDAAEQAEAAASRGSAPLPPSRGRCCAAPPRG